MYISLFHLLTSSEFEFGVILESLRKAFRITFRQAACNAFRTAPSITLNFKPREELHSPFKRLVKPSRQRRSIKIGTGTL